MSRNKTAKRSPSVAWSGTGLITGKPVMVWLESTPPGSGRVFRWQNGETLRPELSAVVHTDHGVTLATSTGRTLSIVEHFLGALTFCGMADWTLHLSDDATELPLLDGSADEWVFALRESELSQKLASNPCYQLTEPVTLTPTEITAITAEPAERFAITYQLDLDHPDFRDRSLTWTLGKDNESLILQAQTFGWEDDLPGLQARGLAKGVTFDNTLGLRRDGSYTRPLRFPDEPLYHKMLDCIGDLSLTGINPLQIGMHVTARNAGHTAHIALARLLTDRQLLKPSN